jgi:hypothetical protein
MALSTLLDILQRAADELGLPRPSSAASADVGARQLFALANATGRDLMRVHDWGALQTLATITTQAGIADYALPADFHRVVPDTHWDRSNDWRMSGPDTPQMDRWRRESGVAETGTRRTFRQVGGKVRIFPTPTAAGQELVYEYVSQHWARSATNTVQEEMAADTDTCVFSKDLMVKGVKWRFMAAKGLYADALRDEFNDLRDLEIAADIGGTTLDMAPSEGDGPIDLGSLPDGNWSL